jgi:1-acyl-sn-glycerol-3-phosphate acyltransferase
MRTLITMATLLLATPFFGGLAIIASVLGRRNTPGSYLDRAPAMWARMLLRAAGVRVVVHGEEQLKTGEPRIFVSNHVSWFDVLALASVLPRYRFVGKAELTRVPLFGKAAVATAMIPIERDNRKAAFESYEAAADVIRAGTSVAVFPEGTRGPSYSLRPFKKGPFVLAVAAGVPVVPTIVHGTIHVNPRGSLRARSGVVHVHFLPPVPAAGLAYDDRDGLARAVWQRMADALRDLYGVTSEPLRPVVDRVAERIDQSSARAS